MDFLRKLQCLSDQRPTGKKWHCQLVVNDEFTITSFTCEDGEHKAASTSSIRVNDAITLSLDPEIIGTVLKIPFAGRPVPARIFAASRVLSLRVVKDRRLVSAQRRREGFRISTFQRNFRKYIARRGRELFILESCSFDGFISGAKACALMDEFLNNATFNWAEDRACHIRRVVSRACAQKGAGGKLSTNVKSILSSYISAALRLIDGHEVLDKPIATHAQDSGFSGDVDLTNVKDPSMSTISTPKLYVSPELSSEEGSGESHEQGGEEKKSGRHEGVKTSDGVDDHEQQQPRRSSRVLGSKRSLRHSSEGCQGKQTRKAKRRKNAGLPEKEDKPNLNIQSQAAEATHHDDPPSLRETSKVRVVTGHDIPGVAMETKHMTLCTEVLLKCVEALAGPMRDMASVALSLAKEGTSEGRRN